MLFHYVFIHKDSKKASFGWHTCESYFLITKSVTHNPLESCARSKLKSKDVMSKSDPMLVVALSEVEGEEAKEVSTIRAGQNIAPYRP